MPEVHAVELAAAAPRVHHDAPRERRPRGPLAATLVALLQARKLDDALDAAAASLDACPSDDPQRAAVEKAIGVAMGREPIPGRWGVDPVADWLRARLLDATGESTGWLGILAWLGRHGERWLRSTEALDAMPLAAAALVVARGSKHALATAGATLREARQVKDGADLLRALVLRGALEGEFDPDTLRTLVPSPRRGGGMVAAAWKPLLLARRALSDGGHVLGAAHQTAAMVATDVRRRLLDDLRSRGRHVRLPTWGSRALDEKDASELHAAILDGSAGSFAHPGELSSAPWPVEWGGPDTREVLTALARLLGCDLRLASEAFAHDGLALAAVHALGGHATNAMAALGASRTPPALDDVRAWLARAIHGGVGGVALPADRPTGPEAEGIYRQLRRLPDPSLALETPYGLLGAQRAEAQHALQSGGRLQHFRDVRLLLDRPDVAGALAPFWILRDEPGQEAALVALVRRTVADLPPPTPDECLRFLRSLE